MIGWREFALWREGVMHALDGGLWLHRFTLRGEPWAHLVSSNRQALIDAGRVLGLHRDRIQYRPLRDPRTGKRVEAWHWDLRRERLARALELAEPRLPYRDARA
jgi:hypothetical protein